MSTIEISPSNLNTDVPPGNRDACTTGVISIVKVNGADKHLWYRCDDQVLQAFVKQMQTKGYVSFSRTVFSAPASWKLWNQSVDLMRYPADHPTQANELCTVIKESGTSTEQPSFALSPFPKPSPTATAGLAANIALTSLFPGGNAGISADDMVKIWPQ